MSYRSGSLTKGGRTRRLSKTQVKLHRHHHQPMDPAVQQLHHYQLPLWSAPFKQPSLLLLCLVMVQLPLLPWQEILLLLRLQYHLTGHPLLFLHHNRHPALQPHQLLRLLLPVLNLWVQYSLATLHTRSKAPFSYQPHCSCLTPISMGMLQSQAAQCLVRHIRYHSGRQQWSRWSDVSLCLQFRLSQCSVLSLTQHYNPTPCPRLPGPAPRSPGNSFLLSTRPNPSRLHSRMQGMQAPTCLHSSQVCLSRPALPDQQ